MNADERVRAYIDGQYRRQFLADVLALYEAEQTRNSVNPTTTLGEALDVNAGTLAGWVQSARWAAR